MSLLQQLNVDADHLAGGYITMHWNDDFSKAPIYPTSGCQFDLSHGTITYKLKRELRWARTEPPYGQYVCDKYKWTEATYHSIDWECLRCAINWKSEQR